MLEVAEALALVLAEAVPPAAVELPARLGLGCLLAEDVFSDVDSPPHDKSIVDGYALRAANCLQQPILDVLEQVTAGEVPTKTVGPGQATQIMTGAPLPSGADAVVMVEKTERVGTQVRILQDSVRPNQNIVRRGQVMRAGDCVLAAGRLLTPVHLGLLAEVGKERVQCVERPRVATIATGNELVPVGQVPGPGQIRNSNESLLDALVCDVGGQGKPCGVARDEYEDLRFKIARELESAEVVLLSGGVSEGVADLVPRVLSDLGVRKVFHKVSLKPGKPLWFGVKEHEDGQRTLVFGLPGNPVSSLVCFQLFVRPALEKLAGREPRGMERFSATLACPFTSRGDRPTYWPGKSSAASVEALRWQGSGDLRTLADADCLIFFPPGQQEYAAGDAATAYRL